MLPYFIFTEEVQGFCSLMGYTVDADVLYAKYVCMYTLEYSPKPRITSHNLDPDSHPYIPKEKVLDYLALLLDGYSYHDAISELGFVWE